MNRRHSNSLFTRTKKRIFLCPVYGFFGRRFVAFDVFRRCPLELGQGESNIGVGNLTQTHSKDE